MGSKDQEDQAALSRLKHKTLFNCQRTAPYSGVTTAKRFSSTRRELGVSYSTHFLCGGISIPRGLSGGNVTFRGMVLL